MVITAHISGQRFPRAAVLAWELRRATKVARKLGLAAGSSDVTELRRTLVEQKRALGHDGVENLLARELRWSERFGRIGATLSRGRRRLCTIELASDTGSAEAVPNWYRQAIRSNDETPLLAACPDHYLSRTRADGREEVIETTGGAPLAVRMFFDDTDLSTLVTPADAAFPRQWAGIARLADGTPIGGIRHQFRDSPSGFRARLGVEFPVTTPGFMIHEHQWHLACEFSNWIETVNADVR